MAHTYAHFLAWTSRGTVTALREGFCSSLCSTDVSVEFSYLSMVAQLLRTSIRAHNQVWMTITAVPHCLTR